MPNEFDATAARSQGDKLNRMVGKRGEYPGERAARIAGVKRGTNAQGDSGDAEEVFIGAPARQVSNYGKVRK